MLVDIGTIVTFAVALISAVSATPLPSEARSSSSSLAILEKITLSLKSNDATYGPKQVLEDLRTLQSWAGDTASLSPAEESEVVAAVLSAASRYYPELPTKEVVRVILSDIKAESDFQPKMISGARLDSGASWGLMQVSPDGESQELALFQKHARTKRNVLSWDASPDFVGAGPLLDPATGARLDVNSLTHKDLYRPFINVHVACWIQSNSGRTSSQDPTAFPAISAAATTVRLATEGPGQSLASSASQRQRPSVTDAQIAKKQLKELLVGAGLPRTLATGLGTWVAGAASNGHGAYAQPGDDVSSKYLRAIMQGVSRLYGKKLEVDWLDSLTLHSGLVDYH